ncbi:MAG: hypothetical protein A2Y25_06035 [Candidatus Melainabacteria bacterium GWF2_37_15]|nr:MAG: hypothetical protein A2Y25_06035 [Candidatus Melainabacteria bacterium GWF2_37_15]
MGIAANKFRLLFLKAHQSDIEYKLTLIFNRRKALLDQSMQIASQQSNNVFDTDDYSELYDGQTPGALPGFTNPVGGVPIQQDPVPTGSYEEQTAVLHALDQQLEMDAEGLKVLLESAKTEVEAVDKLLFKNIEKEYKTFSHS